MGTIIEWIDRLKGWRTVIVNFLLLFVTTLEGIDVMPLFESICAIVDSFGGNCSTTGAAAIWGSIITFLNMLLRKATTTPLGKRTAEDK